MKNTLFSIILILLAFPLFSQNDTITFTVRGVRFDMVKIEGATYQKSNYYRDSMNRLNYHVPKRAGCDTSLTALDMGFRIVLDGNSPTNKTNF